ncbi:MAG TPA: nuclear transport factor 2 family protein [Steroidobacteraceae bacterium]|nr:nuclear transport factor 2 family protein [Steroidobacteraceae bacterium]
MTKATALVSTLVLLWGTAAASEDPLKEVAALERARFQAQIAMDVPALRSMLADDLYYCHSSGVCQNKEQFIGFVTSGTNKYLAMDVIDMKPRLIGDAVVVNGKLDIRVVSDGKEQHFQGIYTDVYAKRKGRWQLVTWQSTRIP